MVVTRNHARAEPREVASVAARYLDVRAATERLCAPLTVEDHVIQSMPDVSPTKWHLAHTSWFFETFVLKPADPSYVEANPDYAYLFNSYYVQAGARHCRAQRGSLSRPTVAEVLEYRRHVDAGMERLLDRGVSDRWASVVEVGLHHEQQHQELIVTDIKHVLSVNPLRPAYRTDGEAERVATPVDASARLPERVPAHAWVEREGGLARIGHEGGGFAFDNEGPRHRAYLEPYALGSRLVTNGEYLEFMADGGYRTPTLWLSLGWQTVESNGWTAPFYWELRDGEWWSFTLAGMRPVDPAEPVAHVTYFEADAYARWAGARLPTEAEWEVVAADLPVEGNFAESGRLHPAPAPAGTFSGRPLQMFGDLWEWTMSPYAPYPGFRPAEGALGEYNGKFMCNQMVLRGGSCATPASHVRPTYRNFFPPDASWQFTGFRLARDA